MWISRDTISRTKILPETLGWKNLGAVFGGEEITIDKTTYAMKIVFSGGDSSQSYTKECIFYNNFSFTDDYLEEDYSSDYVVRLPDKIQGYIRLNFTYYFTEEQYKGKVTFETTDTSVRLTLYEQSIGDNIDVEKSIIDDSLLVNGALEVKNDLTISSNLLLKNKISFLGGIASDKTLSLNTFTYKKERVFSEMKTINIINEDSGKSKKWTKTYKLREVCPDLPEKFNFYVQDPPTYRFWATYDEDALNKDAYEIEEVWTDETDRGSYALTITKTKSTMFSEKLNIDIFMKWDNYKHTFTKTNVRETITNVEVFDNSNTSVTHWFSWEQHGDTLILNYFPQVTKPYTDEYKNFANIDQYRVQLYTTSNTIELKDETLNFNVPVLSFKDSRLQCISVSKDQKATSDCLFCSTNSELQIIKAGAAFPSDGSVLFYLKL